MATPTITPGETRIGWIGTGVMGASMCGHLMETGFTATVYSRTKSKAQPLLDKGAIAPVLDSTYPLDAAAEAHARMESSADIGKIILKV